MADFGDCQRRDNQAGPVLPQELHAAAVVAVSGVEGSDQRPGIAENHADAAPPASSRSAKVRYLSWFRPRSAGPRKEPISADRCLGSAGGTWDVIRLLTKDPAARAAIERRRPATAARASLLRILDVAIWMQYSKSRLASKAQKHADDDPESPGTPNSLRDPSQAMTTIVGRGQRGAGLARWAGHDCPNKVTPSVPQDRQGRTVGPDPGLGKSR